MLQRSPPRSSSAVTQVAVTVPARETHRESQPRPEPDVGVEAAAPRSGPSSVGDQLPPEGRCFAGSRWPAGSLGQPSCRPALPLPSGAALRFILNTKANELKTEHTLATLASQADMPQRADTTAPLPAPQTQELCGHTLRNFPENHWRLRAALQIMFRKQK